MFSSQREPQCLHYETLGPSYASVAEWSIALGCKPSGFGLRGFESLSAHNSDSGRITTQHPVPLFWYVVILRIYTFFYGPFRRTETSP
jgi:hypothetical protein